MKFNPAIDRSSRTVLHVGGLLASTLLFAATRGAAVASPSEEAEAGGGDEAGGDADVTSQVAGTGTGTGTGAAAKAKVSTKSVEETVADTGLVTLVKQYDEVKEKATSYMCDIAEYIGKENLGRPVVIKTLMEARGITLETAASYASRLMKLAKSPEDIAGLRDGSVTIRETMYGRPKPGATTTAAGATSAAGAAAGGGKKTDTEKKEDKYNRVLNEFTEVAKASGFSLAEIMLGVSSSLKSAGIK